VQPLHQTWPLDTLFGAPLRCNEGQIGRLAGSEENSPKDHRGKGPVMSFDAITALNGANQPVEDLTPDQRGLLESLSPAEVAILNQLKGELDFAGDDIEAPPHTGNIIL